MALEKASFSVGASRESVKETDMVFGFIHRNVLIGNRFEPVSDCGFFLEDLSESMDRPVSRGMTIFSF